MSISTVELDQFEKQFGVVPKVVSRLIRPCFIAPKGKVLVWSDWSAIEARVLPWLAGSKGADRVLDTFRACDADPGLPDIYRIEAGRIFEKHPANIGEKGDERQTGKVATLALGFGGGVGALSAMAASYGLVLGDNLKQHIVTHWRKNNQWAVTFWKELDDAFQNAWQQPNAIFTAGRVSLVYRPNYLFGTMFIAMPCRRTISYPALRRDKVKIEDDYGDVTEEWKVRYQSGYERKSIWHGILAENITQGFAASLLRDVIVRCRNYSLFGLIGHTHDEIVAECDEDLSVAVANTLTIEMEYVPPWAEGLPLVAETTTSWVYTKAI